MEVTEIKVFPIDEEKLKAFVSIVIDNCFMVNDIKVIKGRDGLFISMPSRRKKNGKFKDVAHPLNNETRQMIEKLILAEYDRALRGLEIEEERLAEPEPEPPIAAPEPAVEAPEPQPPAEAAEPQPEAEEVPASAEPLAAAPESAEGKGKSLEEVTEMHLRDSFWSS